MFACATARGIWRLFPGERTRFVVTVSENYADGLVTKAILKAARKKASRCERSTAATDAFMAAQEAAICAANDVSYLALGMPVEEAIIQGYLTKTPAGELLATQVRADQSAYLRDIFGNPFRAVTLDPAWQTATVVSLAQAIYEDRAFDRMPILADALEDGGCTNADVLTHCRQPGEHVRGCWVVDLLLGKQ
jgi:hypothetical protein